MANNTPGPGNDFLAGTEGDDTIDGLAGNDTLNGGKGNDFLLGQSGNDVLSGDAGDDSLSGGAGNDVLDGGAGIDVLTGGAGNDVYVVDSSLDAVIEAAGGGIDEVQAVGFSVNIDGRNNIENLTLLGASDNNAFGNDVANKITGGSGVNLLGGGNGNDTLDGGAGGDRLIGGFGNDTFIVGDAGDLVEDGKGQGKDTVLASANFTLAAGQEIEKLILVGDVGLDGTGNEFNNVITGNSGNNFVDGGNGNDTLAGGGGDDVLLGGEGNDVMTGGKGNDVYFVDSVGDKLTEAANQGGDNVFSILPDFTLGANFENLDLGSGAINGTGNNLDNDIDGNDLDNKLDGAAGNDDLRGKSGNDTLLGGAGNDELNGEDGIDFLDGGSGDDVLRDASGGDTLKGGAGNDTYAVRGNATIITELANAGIDTVQAFDTGFSLADLGNVENLALFNLANNGTGNDLSNKITGNSRGNVLDGGKGNDTLDGGDGGDVLFGGLGNDTYIVDDANDQVFEAVNAGKDTVLASVSFELAAEEEIERLTLTGSDDIDAGGNEFANIITGNGGNNGIGGGKGNDTLIGGDGDDILNGTEGNDVLTGGKGNDLYFVEGLGDKLTEAANQGIDAVVSTLANFTLGANFENLFLDGTALNGTGNGLGNLINGNDSDNRLDGGAGNDVLNDGAGNDTLIGGTGDDELSSANGLDVLNGGAGNDTLRDIGGGDLLKGGTGNDLYIVRTANSTIVEAANGGIDTVEAVDISFNLEALATIENLRLVGTNTTGVGNALANKIAGGSSFNFLFGLDGNDTLDGGAGPDLMDGGFGNDTFLVDDANDFVLERIGQGRDTILASTDHTIAGGQEIEALTLTGSEDLAAIGNELANTLTGNGGKNFLKGGGGGDVLAGAGGNDFYVVEDVRDKVIEAAGADIDTVNSTLNNYTLTANVEVLLLADAALNGTGNGLANAIIGNAIGNKLDGAAGNDEIFGDGGDDTLIGGLGNDQLEGGNGNDTLSGGAGNDVLEGGDGADILIGDAGKDVFFYLVGDPADLATLGGDTIKGFARGADKIDLSVLLDDFDIDPANAIAGGFLQLQASGVNTVVNFDSNGGGDNLVTLATVTNAALTASDFVLSSNV